MSDGSKTPPTPVVLLVEDNDDDVEFTRLGFQQSSHTVDLHVVRDGEECMAFLRKEAAYTDAPTPDLVLLDLNMPRMDGREVIAEIARDERLAHLPVVILTTSADEREIMGMYRLRCSSYVVKPIEFTEMMRVIDAIAGYWFTVATLPPKV